MPQRIKDRLLRQATKNFVGRTEEIAMLPDLDPQAAYDRLRTLPFVESSHDGLIVHDAVRYAIEAMFRASDPSQYHTYRHLAWRQLRTELDMASKPELWRYTADTIYLIQQSAVREAFFPSTEHSLNPGFSPGGTRPKEFIEDAGKS